MKFSVFFVSLTFLNIYQFQALPETIPLVPRNQKLEIPDLKVPSDSINIEKPEAPDLENSTGNESITIGQFQFEGNTIYSSKTLSRLLTSFIGKKLTFLELLQVRSQITKYYNENGYITSYAYLPLDENQKLNPKNSTVVIRVVENSVSDISIVGTNQLNEFIKSRLKPTVFPAINQNKLNKALFFLKARPFIKDISVLFSKSVETGKYNMIVEVKTHKKLFGKVGFSNTGNTSTGIYQSKQELGISNILGKGDIFKISSSQSEGGFFIESDLTVPIGSSDTSLSLRYFYGNSKVITKPFNIFDLNSKSQAIGFTARHPVYRSLNSTNAREVSVGISFDHNEYQGSFLNIPFPILVGADEDGKSKETTISLFQEFSSFGTKQSLLARSEFRIGLDSWATINTTPPDGRFLKWTGQLSWQRKLSSRLALIANTTAQISDRPLFSFEQLNLTGEDAVRGYPQNSFLTNSGLVSSFELNIYALLNNENQFIISPFFDIGIPFKSQGNNPDLVSSLGLSLSYRHNSCPEVKLTLGVPLVSFLDSNESLKSSRLSFNLVCSF